MLETAELNDLNLIKHFLTFHQPQLNQLLTYMTYPPDELEEQIEENVDVIVCHELEVTFTCCKASQSQPSRCNTAEQHSAKRTRVQKLCCIKNDL